MLHCVSDSTLIFLFSFCQLIEKLTEWKIMGYVQEARENHVKKKVEEGMDFAQTFCVASDNILRVVLCILQFCSTIIKQNSLCLVIHFSQPLLSSRASLVNGQILL